MRRMCWPRDKGKGDVPVIVGILQFTRMSWPKGRGEGDVPVITACSREKYSNRKIQVFILSIHTKHEIYI